MAHKPWQLKRDVTNEEVSNKYMIYLEIKLQKIIAIRNLQMTQ